MKKPSVKTKIADSKSKSKHSSPGTFSIIGIGASAGGLEAIEQFLSGVPKDSGMAFVVVQHLDPNHKGILCEFQCYHAPHNIMVLIISLISQSTICNI